MEGWTIEKFSNVVVYTKKPKGLKVSFPIPFVAMDLVPLDKMEINSFKLIDKVKSGNYVEDGDILLAKITPSFENGKQGILRIGKKYAYATTEVIPFKGKDNFADTLYLAYHLKKDDLRIELAEKMEGSTGRQRLSKSVLNDLPIPLPPLSEQHKIAHVLSTIQKAIEQQDKLIRTTTELKKTLMQKLFTEGTKGEPQKETEIGLVPESWEVKPFSEIFEIIKTQSHSRNKLTYEKTDTKILNIHYGDIHAKFKGNIVDLELEEVPYIIDEYVDENKNNFLREGDIVIADASEDLIDIGKCIELKNVKNKKMIGGLHTIVARDKINLIQKGFGAYIFKNKYVSSEMRLIATGLSVYGISKGNLLKMLIPIPSVQEQVEIAETMDKCNKKIFYHQKKKQTLTDLFKTLLHELMTGQRRVHELEFEEFQ